MALTFPAGTDYVDHGSDASLDDIAAGTVLTWVRVVATTGAQRVFGKGLFTLRVDSSERPNFIRGRATTLLETVGDTALPTGSWVCMAAVWDVNGVDGDQRLYTGSLTQALTEPGYVNQTVGAGTVSSDAASNLTVNVNSAQRWQGDVGSLMIFNRQLSLEELRQLQYRPVALSGCVLWTRPGYLDATSTQADYSGSGNHGTIAGSPTRVSPVPLGRWHRRTHVPYTAPVSYSLSPAQGTFSLTGQAASLTAQRALVASQGAITLSGQSAALTVQRSLIPAAGAVTLTGQTATLTIHRALVPAQGLFTLTGQDASLIVSAGSQTLDAAAGLFTLTGQAATLTVTPLVVEPEAPARIDDWSDVEPWPAPMRKARVTHALALTHGVRVRATVARVSAAGEATATPAAVAVHAAAPSVAARGIHNLPDDVLINLLLHL